ncbi:MAG TPA: hypothetical protein VG538_05840 [Vicinamibacterales bacterium]|nr:hypothetical protein [Vicinamibacterales bacterium]
MNNQDTPRDERRKADADLPPVDDERVPVPEALRRRSDRLLDRTAREWGEDGKASGPAGPYDSGV